MTNKLPFGSAFSCLNQTLICSDEIQEILNSPDNVIVQYDEFGFRLPSDRENSQDSESKEEQGQTYNSIKQKWISFLENEYKKISTSSCHLNDNLSQFDADMITPLPLLDKLICQGITNELRSFFWTRFSRALHLKIESKWTFTQLIDLSSDERTLTVQQITQVLPNNICFTMANSVCSKRLQKILRIVKWYQKTNLVANQYENNHTNESQHHLNESLIGAYLLLVCSEEDAFWLLLRITFSLNINDCIDIITQIMDKCCPIVSGLLNQHDIEFKLIASLWFSTLFAGFVSNAKLLYSLWDLYFYEGPVFLIQITIGLLIIETKSLESCQDSKEFFNNLSDLPMNSFNSQEKIVYAWKSGKNIVSNLNLSSEFYHYEPLASAEHLLKLNSNNKINDDEMKIKNVKQTALIMRLHEAIVAIAQHFQAYDLNCKYNLEPDYDQVDKIDSKQDLSNRLRPYQRRAKALIDFPSDDPDELGFAKNDILTIINEKDEHCWIGELNGRIGWFPAKFVEVLDERDQNYCIAGDDRVVPFINDLVRGKLSSALKAILSYDMKKSYFFTIHPWTIVEEISTLCANSDLKSVYSRLVLTKTFRLDEYARILSPNDLLYRSIALINTTHVNCPMDIKLRSLICLGLNQYVLHDWFELICVCKPSIILKSYGPNSFLTSPAWKLIKAELKLLVQFSFHLNPNAEIESVQEPKSPVTKEGVCDMLVKYHLFSWDI